MNATLYIHNLKLKAYIGCEPPEQKRKQTIYIDVEIETDIEEALKTDDISKALDYRECINRIEEYLKHSKHALIETLAYKLLEYYLTHPRAKKVTLTLKKPSALKNAEWTGIQVSKGRS